MKINLDELSGPIDSVLLRHRNWLFHYDHLDRTPQFRPDHKYDDLILDVERHLKKVSHFIDDSDDNETSTPADQTRLRIGLRNEYVQDSLPEMFRHFITPSMIAQIVTHTNRAIERSKDGKSLLTEAEMYAFIGLRLLIAANNDKQNKLWRVGINQKRMYTGILSRNRYAYLNIKMEFTGHKERRSAITPPFAMKFFYDEFGAQCRRVYKPTGDMLVSNIRYDFESKSKA